MSINNVNIFIIFFIFVLERGLMPSFSERLKELRVKNGKTQRQMAEFLEITERNYQRYEYGNVDPIASNTLKLADFFNVSTDYLLGRSDNPERC